MKLLLRLPDCQCHFYRLQWYLLCHKLPCSDTAWGEAGLGFNSQGFFSYLSICPGTQKFTSLVTAAQAWATLAQQQLCTPGHCSHRLNLLQGKKGYPRTLHFPISIACLQSHENRSPFTLQLHLLQSGMSSEERQMTYLLLLTQKLTTPGRVN